jgi:hypothetical protein
MHNLINKKVLVMSDGHQCLKYYDTVLEREPNWDHIVFLGDYLDCFEDIDNENYFSVKKTCEWINQKFEKWGDKASWLIGNHTVSYLSSYLPQTYRIQKNVGYICSGWTKNKASEFNKYINPEWVRSLELCCQVDNYILSHAGFHPSHFLPHMSEIDNIKRLHDEWESDKATFSNQAFHWIGAVGSCRGGIDDVGSPVWLDWNHEFVPIDGIKQIVGHTNSHEWREKSGNYCIDAYRTCYAIIQNDQIKIRYI